MGEAMSFFVVHHFRSEEQSDLEKRSEEQSDPARVVYFECSLKKEGGREN